MDFYHRLAMERLLPKKLYNLALKYVNAGLRIDPGNAVLKAD